MVVGPSVSPACCLPHLLTLTQSTISGPLSLFVCSQHNFVIVPAALLRTAPPASEAVVQSPAIRRGLLAADDEEESPHTAALLCLLIEDNMAFVFSAMGESWPCFLLLLHSLHTSMAVLHRHSSCVCVTPAKTDHQQVLAITYSCKRGGTGHESLCWAGHP